MNVDQLLSQVADAARRGALADAETLCRSVLETAPRHLFAWMLLADILVLRNRTNEALAAYDTAAGINPGFSLPSSRAAIVRFRMAHGQPVKARNPSGGGRIQMTRLGAHGRFGNQLLQYGFVRLYAAEHDLTAEFPDWIGRDVFDCDDPVPRSQLPPIDEKEFGGASAFGNGASRVLSGRDVTGFFCGHTSEWGDRASRFRALFTPGRKIRAQLEQASQVLASAGTTLVAIHLRRADFGYGRFWVAPAKWYLDWLRALWPGLDRPVLYVATDDRAAIAPFAEFSPLDAHRLGVSIPGADFLVDHHVLRQASHLAISNSSFSFSAAMLNDHARTFMRPHPNRRELIPFDPWSAYVLLDPVVEPNEIAPDHRSILEQHFRAGDRVVHVGQYCSPWTHLARSLHPEMRIHELDDAESVDELSGRIGKEIRHLVVESIDLLPRTLASASATLAADVHMVHFSVPEKSAMAIVPETLERNGYRLYRSSDGALVPVDTTIALVPGWYVARANALAR